MKNILISFLFVHFAVSITVAQDTAFVYYDDNWEEIEDKDAAKYYRKAFVDSNKQYWAYDYYLSSNKIQMIGTYKSKRYKNRHGNFVYYYENGQKTSEGIIENDKNTGDWHYWYENGKTKSFGSIDDGLLNGKWEYFFDDGQKKSEGYFEYGKRVGDWFFYKDGVLATKEIYEDGKIVQAEGYFPNGNISFKGGYVNGKLNGIWIYWNEDNRIILKGPFKNGKRNGEWIRYFVEGEMKINYIDGVLQGKALGGIVRNM